MNILIFSSDAKSLSSLNSIIKESSEQGHRLFAMITQETQLQYPSINKQKFQILCNIPRVNHLYSNSLKEWLPFTPDYVVVNRERWNPESDIINEFTKIGSKIVLVEPNAWILNNAETRLETYSRNRWVDKIDTFFVGSKHNIEEGKVAGFQGNMVAVGNPKYDLNTEVLPEDIKTLREVYFASEDKENVLLFSLINGNRGKLNEIYKRHSNDKSKRYFYKPYPGEPFDPKFRNDYHPCFFLPHTVPIIDEKHIWGMFQICDTHVGVMSSIVHASLLSGKKYIDHSLELGLPEKYLDFSGVFQEGGPGLENNLAMWMNSFGFSNVSQLKALLPNDYRDRIEKTNKRVWENLDKPDKLLILFDDYNDGNAAKRILNELQK